MRRHEWTYPDAPSPRQCRFCLKSEYDLCAGSQEIGVCEGRAPLPHDPESFFLARVAVRQAYEAVRRLPQRDSAVRMTLDALDALAVELTVELLNDEPELAV